MSRRLPHSGERRGGEQLIGVALSQQASVAEQKAGVRRACAVQVDAGFRVFSAAEQTFTGVEYKGSKPGHVVLHAGKTVLFTDGTGEVNVFDPEDLDGGKNPQGRTYTSAEPHHGVAIELSDGHLLSTLGTEEKRTGALVLDKNNKEIKRNEKCPGVHGEAAAKGEAIGIGCEDGLLIYKDGKFTKVDAPDGYGRIGNQRGSDASPILLGDYRTDPEAELERPSGLPGAHCRQCRDGGRPVAGIRRLRPPADDRRRALSVDNGREWRAMPSDFAPCPRVCRLLRRFLRKRPEVRLIRKDVWTHRAEAF
ncbi:MULTISPECIES: hypothetical protein [unclassified Streptomyces]|uniref:hypothetical protein n=1 Tax=unclassified Streptomyces TaxID=2593676 RepID=UPI0036DFCD48